MVLLPYAESAGLVEGDNYREYVDVLVVQRWRKVIADLVNFI